MRVVWGQGVRIASSRLTRLECLVKPVRMNDALLLADHDAFIKSPDLLMVSLPEPIFERATIIQRSMASSLVIALTWPQQLVTALICFSQMILRLDAFPTSWSRS